MKKIVTVIVGLVLLGVAFWFGVVYSNNRNHKQIPTVAMVTDGGGVDDDSFNAATWKGLVEWGKEHHVAKGPNGYTYAQSLSDADFFPNMDKLVKKGYSTIIATGYRLTDAIEKASKKYPDTNFVMIDTVVKRPNVASVQFRDNEAAFLAGVAAAKTSKSKQVGFIGGTDSPIMAVFYKGFAQGVHTVDPNIRINKKYVGTFSQPRIGQSLAAAMYDNGVDVIYTVAGGSGEGAFTAAKAVRKNLGRTVWVIGVDQDQSELGEYDGGNVTLASTIKRVDVAVKDMANKAMTKKFPGGKTIYYDLSDRGVDIVNTSLPKSTWKLIQSYKQQIIAGQIKVAGRQS